MFYVAVHAFVINDGKVLLLKRQNTGYKDGYFSVPAGHVDGKETIAFAVKRELFEESGIKVTGNILPSHVMHRIQKNEERIDYFYLFTSWHGHVVNKEPHKCAELSWFKTNQLPKNMIPYVRKALVYVLKGQLFSEFNDLDDGS